jgi:hypothetical protein
MQATISQMNNTVFLNNNGGSTANPAPTVMALTLPAGSYYLTGMVEIRNGSQQSVNATCCVDRELFPVCSGMPLVAAPLNEASDGTLTIMTPVVLSETQTVKVICSARLVSSFNVPPPTDTVFAFGGHVEAFPTAFTFQSQPAQP